jgi:hypothetical protein
MKHISPDLVRKWVRYHKRNFFRSTPEKWWRNQFTAEEPPIHAFYWRKLACIRKEFTAHEPPNINVLSEDGLNTAVGSVFDLIDFLRPQVQFIKGEFSASAFVILDGASVILLDTNLSLESTNWDVDCTVGLSHRI